jgi:hypothetical protein
MKLYIVQFIFIPKGLLVQSLELDAADTSSPARATAG